MIKYIPIIHPILISSFKASIYLSLYCILNNLNINQILSDINYMYILNFLIIIIFTFKIYIGYSNYKKTFKYMFDIYKFTKNFYISYCTIINYKYIEEDIYTNEYDIHDHTTDEYRIDDFKGKSYLEENYRESSYIDNINLSSIKKINMLYIKEILIIYISHTIYIHTGIFTNSSFFREFKKINSFIYNEIQKDHYDFKYDSKELHSNYIELLILKNLMSLKNNNYFTSDDYSILYNSFYNLQNSICKLQTLSFKNNKVLHGDYLINFILILNILNLIFYYIQNKNDSYLDGIIIFIISFFIYFINDITTIFINIFKNLDKIFDCEGYIFNLNDELFLLNYFYLSNLEYKI